MKLNNILKNKDVEFYNNKYKTTHGDIIERAKAFSAYLVTNKITYSQRMAVYCKDNIYMTIGALSAENLGISYIIIDNKLSDKDMQSILDKNDIEYLITDYKDVSYTTYYCIPEIEQNNINHSIENSINTLQNSNILRLAEGYNTVQLSSEYMETYRTALIKAIAFYEGRKISINTFSINQNLLWDLIFLAINVGMPLQLSCEKNIETCDNTINIISNKLFKNIVKGHNNVVNNTRENQNLIIVGDIPLLSAYLCEWRNKYSSAYIEYLFYSSKIPIFLTVNKDLIEYSKYGQDIEIIPIGKPIIDSGCMITDINNKKNLIGKLGYLRIKNMLEYNELLNTGYMGRYLSNNYIQIQSLETALGKEYNPVDLRILEDYILESKIIKNVVCIEDDKNWKCYISSDSKEKEQLNSVLSSIKKKLPKHLLPVSISLVKEIDGNKTREMLKTSILDGILETVLVQENEEPQTYTQEIMLNIAKEVLKNSTIQINDDLLSLGLDSIKAIQMVTAFKEHNLKVEIMDVFTEPSIKQLDRVVKNIDKETQNSNLRKTRYLEESYNLITHDRSLKKAEELFDADFNVEGVYPLSSMQEMILAQNINYKGTGNDITLLRYEIEGKFNIDLFRVAWQKIIDKNSILRTAFLWRRLKEPLQVVYKDIEIPFMYLDITKHNEDEKKSIYEKYIESEKTKPYNIAEPPLISVHIIRYTEFKWKFMLKCQNSLFDGWSSNIIFNDLLQTYDSLRNGEEINIKGYYPYINYIDWLKQQSIEKAQQYWIKEFEGFKYSVEDDKHSKYQIRKDFECKESNIYLSTSEIQQITDFSEKNHITLYTMFQGAWALLQSRLTESDDLLITSITSGRPTNLNKSESIIGLFSNTLPSRITISEDKSLLDWLKNLQIKNIKQKDYDYITVHEISQWTKIPLNIIQEAIYSRTMVYLNFPTDIAIEEDYMKIEQEVEAGYVNVPLRLYIQPAKDYKITIRYDGFYFTEEEINDLINDYKKIALSFL